ncbi:MAG TPA: hypothetical protein VJB57_02340 [Dehalococcoidia bacterium]|nr:hypothetical protein [Dehalococcoidia bacterium]
MRDSNAGVPSRPGDTKVFAKTQDVLAYHQDAAQEGRPLYLLLGGAAVAMVCLVLIGMLAYRTWYLQEIQPDQAYFGVSFLFCFYVLGVFLFCYAYELYDLPRALRLTLIAAVVSVILLVLVIGSLASLAKLKGGASAIAGEGDSVSDGGLLGTIASFAGGDGDRGRDRDWRRRSWRRMGSFDPPTRESIPFLVNCLGCGEMFTPVPPKAACPHCGRAAITS